MRHLSDEVSLRAVARAYTGAGKGWHGARTRLRKRATFVKYEDIVVFHFDIIIFHFLFKTGARSAQFAKKYLKLFNILVLC